MLNSGGELDRLDFGGEVDSADSFDATSVALAGEAAELGSAGRVACSSVEPCPCGLDFVGELMATGLG